MHHAVSVEQAYRYCRYIARSHYENFPVASWLLPKKIRLPVAALYTFARQADDIADEGIYCPEERIAKLESFEHALSHLNALHTVELPSPAFIAIADMVERFDFPVSLLSDLLCAFKQDILYNRYESFEHILNYCQYSAQPIGRAVLFLSGYTDERLLDASDKICTALQLINFLQDIVDDYHARNRVYIAQSCLQQFELSDEDLVHNEKVSNKQCLAHLYIERIRPMLEDNAWLADKLKGGLAVELRLVIQGALLLLNALEKRGGDFQHRPVIGLPEKIKLVGKVGLRTLSPALKAA